jgi:predicted secreted protein
MTAFTGRDVSVEFAIGLESADPTGLTFKDFGMMRTKAFNVSWDTADTTADKSPDYTRTSLVTFKNIEFSGDGVSYTDAVHNQAELEAHVYSPGSETNNQPKVWFRITFPDCVFTGPFIVSEWSKDAAYDDAVTWSMTANSNGAVTRTPV